MTEQNETFDGLIDMSRQPNTRWWTIGQAASGLFILIYWLFVPSVPLPKEVAFWTYDFSAFQEYEDSKKEKIAILRNKYDEQLTAMPLTEVLHNTVLTEYIKRSGKVLYGDKCAGCHGIKGGGIKDEQGLLAPILNDKDWLHGGGIEDIYNSIHEGRMTMMPAHQHMLTYGEIEILAKAIKESKPTSTPLFEEKGCIACHDKTGKGFKDLGSADLTDKIWRFDGSLEGIKHTIKHGVNASDTETREAVMPSFNNLGNLTDIDRKKLAIYVYLFGGGAAEPSQRWMHLPVEANP